jgi:hypothetical protein
VSGDSSQKKGLLDVGFITAMTRKRMVWCAIEGIRHVAWKKLDHFDLFRFGDDTSCVLMHPDVALQFPPYFVMTGRNLAGPDLVARERTA